MNSSAQIATVTPKRLVVLIPTHWEAVMGGAQYQAQLMMEELIREGGYEIYYLARRVDPDFVPTGYEIRRIGRLQGDNFFMDARGLLAALNEIQPDTIYHQVGCAWTGVAAWYAHRHDCRFVWHIASDMDLKPWNHGWLRRLSASFLDKKLLEYGLRHADCVMAQTEYQVRLLKQNYGRDADRIVRNFHPQPVEPIDKSGPVRVLWIANLKPIKQPQIFFDLARDLAHLDVRFVVMGKIFVGEQDMRARMDALDNLDYLGERTQEEVNQLLANAHLLVNKSMLEGFSNTFIQAWMRRVPVLSLSVDPDRLLNERGLGWCADGVYDSLVTTVGQYATDTQLRQRAGEAAERYALEHHCLRNIDEMAALF
ncbi:MAG: glycosyltransferase family 4 protein [Pseudomonadales bacterium]|nr:glycosyltransferase family 4 protein [Pseudomonadales bacterium]MDP6470556.1 glycosyltransferase family 4 protein [Pseudomonadales bacterium]MDP6827858.1 glycosyltransferase family 4 protein [Pseudomonadales bacterium]MDP6970553.1 glycosyltransferase family 4 protein [Pseudomonadales bacterium]